LSALCQNLESADFLAGFLQLTAPLLKAHQPDPAPAKAHINTAGDCALYGGTLTANARPS